MEPQMITNPFEVILTEIQQLRTEVSNLMQQLAGKVENETLDTAQAAEFLGVHKNTIMSMLHRGELRAQRFGRRYLFTREELYSYLHDTSYTGSRPGY